MSELREKREDQLEDVRLVATGAQATSREFEIMSSHVNANFSNAANVTVLDERKMADFVALMGPENSAKSLSEFALRLELSLAPLDTATPHSLEKFAHGLILMTSQAGFTELFQIAKDVHREARLGSGLNRVAELHAAAERALAVARSHIQFS